MIAYCKYDYGESCAGAGRVCLFLNGNLRIIIE
jgi:hypothetical protein